jgi:hypothetical protein
MCPTEALRAFENLEESILYNKKFEDLLQTFQLVASSWSVFVRNLRKTIYLLSGCLRRFSR